MPIYLCQPGSSTKEPWRHGIQVYARPFPVMQPTTSSSPPQQKNSSAGSTHYFAEGDKRMRCCHGGVGPKPQDAPEQIVVVMTGNRHRDEATNEEGQATNVAHVIHRTRDYQDSSEGAAANHYDGNGTAAAERGSSERRRTFIISFLSRYLKEHSSSCTSSSSSLYNYAEADRVLIFCPPSTSAHTTRSGDDANIIVQEDSNFYCEWITRSLVQDGYRAVSLLRDKGTTAIATTNAVDGNHQGRGEENPRFRSDWEHVVGEFISGRANVLVVDGGGTAAPEDPHQASRSGEVEEFLRGKILASSTGADEQNPSDDDEDSDSTAPGGGEGEPGPFLVRRRGILRRQEHAQRPSEPKIDIAMVINLDLSDIDVRRYTARLNYTKKLVVSLFDPFAGLVANNFNKDDTTTTTPLLSAKDLVDVLRTYRQKIPGELLTLSPPPPLISPNRRLRVRRRHHGVGGAVDAVRVNFQQQNEEGKDDADDDGDFEDGARMRSMVRRQQYLHVRNTMIRSHSSSASGDDDDDNDNDDDERESLMKLQSSSSRISSSSRPHVISHYVRPNPVRRLRHAEVVLVDQCLTAYGRTWLRLRWPGELGGFAGFVAVGGDRAGSVVGDSRSMITSPRIILEDDKTQDAVFCTEAIDSISPARMAETMESSITASATVKPSSSQNLSPLCLETDVYYPTSPAMKLLPLYDDGLSANQLGEDEAALLGTLVMENGEPVFCRICREGLHDVDYGLETAAPSSATPQKSGVTAVRGEEVTVLGQYDVVSPTMALSTATTGSTNIAAIDEPFNRSSASLSEKDEKRHLPSGTTTNVLQSASTFPSQQPISHHLVNLPPLVLHHPTAENPLLAPCDCTGSMAFVHYLCIEQWRCRSRHPGARNGLNCETCGAEYTMPPPPSRPASRHDMMNGGAGMGGPIGNNIFAEEDWLEALPPHVLAALRRPHLAWQLGAEAVRRRRLRPVVPVLVSPLVALYCRARRTLKKRGVSRRRWACSLCRRRARWKCVRCLRSYYCSRQCQNVSWHIVHKHVCYKPVRFWWSVAVYTLVTFLLVPRLLQNFPVYDAMVTLLPINFIALGIVGGGVASSVKRSLGVDIRGRVLEIIIVVLTLLLTLISSGLVRGYFGDASKCWGTLSTLSRRSTGSTMGPFYLPLLNLLLLDIPLTQLQKWYLKWDLILSKFGYFSRRFFCAPTPDGNTDYITVGCSPSTRSINPQFYLDERCSADMTLVLDVWIAAIGVLLLRNLTRQLRGVRRNVGAVAGHRRPHQD